MSFLHLYGDGLGKVEAQYQAAVKRLRPDKAGGTEDFQCMQQAMRILRG